MQLTRNLFGMLIDTTKGAKKGTYNFVPVDLSTVFELAYNPSTETYGYIKYKNDVTQVESYAPSMEQEIVLDTTNPMYTFMDEYLNSYPTGSDAKIPCCFARPNVADPTKIDAQVFDEAIVVGGSLNTVDGKLTFTINLNGDPVLGSLNTIYDGTVTFSPKA